MPAHGAQICARAPTKGYVQTGACTVPGARALRSGPYFSVLSVANMFVSGELWLSYHFTANNNRQHHTCVDYSKLNNSNSNHACHVRMRERGQRYSRSRWQLQLPAVSSNMEKFSNTRLLQHRMGKSIRPATWAICSKAG